MQLVTYRQAPLELRLHNYFHKKIETLFSTGDREKQGESSSWSSRDKNAVASTRTLKGYFQVNIQVKTEYENNKLFNINLLLHAAAVYSRLSPFSYYFPKLGILLNYSSQFFSSETSTLYNCAALPSSEVHLRKDTGSELQVVSIYEKSIYEKTLGQNYKWSRFTKSPFTKRHWVRITSGLDLRKVHLRKDTGSELQVVSIYEKSIYEKTLGQNYKWSRFTKSPFTKRHWVRITSGLDLRKAHLRKDTGSELQVVSIYEKSIYEKTLGQNYKWSRFTKSPFTKRHWVRITSGLDHVNVIEVGKLANPPPPLNFISLLIWVEVSLFVPTHFSGGEELYTQMGFLFSEFWPIDIIIVEFWG